MYFIGFVSSKLQMMNELQITQYKHLIVLLNDLESFFFSKELSFIGIMVKVWDCSLEVSSNFSCATTFTFRLLPLRKL